MKKRVIVVRLIFGILLLSLASIGLTDIAPEAQFADPAQRFMNALIDTQYLMLFIIILKLLVGLSLLTNRFVPLALVVFFPVPLNMILFHLFLDLGGIAAALILGIINLYLLFAYIDVYRPMLKAKLKHNETNNISDI